MVEALQIVFPSLDKALLEDELRRNNGNVEATADKLLSQCPSQSTGGVGEDSIRVSAESSNIKPFAIGCSQHFNPQSPSLLSNGVEGLTPPPVVSQRFVSLDPSPMNHLQTSLFRGVSTSLGTVINAANVKASNQPVSFLSSEKNVHTGQRILIILRGLPGSGKSTMARKLVGHSGVICSTDEFFMTKEGRYVFDPSKLEKFHGWNQLDAKHALEKGQTPVIIDNTNTTVKEMIPYVRLALDYGYDVQIKEPGTEWKFDLNELARRNSHGVTLPRLEQMLQRYERSVTVESIIKRLNKFDKKMGVSEARSSTVSAEGCRLCLPNQTISSESDMQSNNKNDYCSGSRQSSLHPELDSLVSSSLQHSLALSTKGSAYIADSDQNLQTCSSVLPSCEQRAESHNCPSSLTISQELQPKTSMLSNTTPLQPTQDSHWTTGVHSTFNQTSHEIDETGAKHWMGTQSIGYKHLQQESDLKFLQQATHRAPTFLRHLYMKCDYDVNRTLDIALSHVPDSSSDYDDSVYAPQNDTGPVVSLMEPHFWPYNWISHELETESSTTVELEPASLQGDFRQHTDDNDLILKLSTSLARKLQSLFGEVDKSLFSGGDDDMVVLLSETAARKIYQDWVDTVLARKEQYQLQLLQKDEELALKLSKEEESQAGYKMALISKGPRQPSMVTATSELQSAASAAVKEYSATLPSFKVQVQQLYDQFSTVDKGTIDLLIVQNRFDFKLTFGILKEQLTKHESTDGALLSKNKQDKRSPLKAEGRLCKETNPALDQYCFEDHCVTYQEIRAEAAVHAMLRVEAFKKAAQARQQNDFTMVAQCIKEANMHTVQMKEANKRAADILINIQKRPNTLDLHGLFVQEAIDALEKRLRVTEKGTNLIVVTGRGAHSLNGTPRIKPAVIAYLKLNQYRYEELNAGLLQVIC